MIRALGALALLAACAPVAPPPPDDPRPDRVPAPVIPGFAPEVPAFPPGLTWDWQLDDPFDYTRAVDVYDLDLDSVEAEDIAALKARGILTICYVSVGTMENYRDDADAFPADVLGAQLGNWPNERYVDIRDLDTLLPIMAARFDTCAAKGFDAVEPDNMDLHHNEPGFPITAAIQTRYAVALAELAHARGLAIGQKNAEDLIPDLLDTFDFIITEHCFASDRCARSAPYPAAGKAAFAAEYLHRPVDFDAACAEARALGLSMIRKDRGLTKDHFEACR
ncbi:MAG: endo alpha-1,4 polygalactosaminidase [Pseudomonadota bacterium]